MSAAVLEVCDISWRPFRLAPPILHPTSFRVDAGRTLGVIGPNGAGKSTLLRQIYRFQKPTSGQILVDGQDIWAIPARAAALKVAAVLQEQTSTFGLTVREIVRLGRTPHRAGIFQSGAPHGEQVIEIMLGLLDLQHLAERNFGTLSGGERQRVMVARALVQEPQVLVLDEPTNHLDIRHQLEIVNLIRTLDLTIVVSLHDLNMALGVCDDILVLQDGHVQGFGPPDAVLTDDLVSNTFRVTAQRENLAPSGAAHFSFNLPEQKD